MSRRILVQGGCVLTLGLNSSNHAAADVLIEGDLIVEIGTGLRARDAEVIDASDAIVMPGFVDSHRHAWTSLFRNGGDEGSMADLDALGAHHSEDDAYTATMVGLLGAVEAGITTVVDWSDIQFDDSFTEAVLQAHVDSGLRTVVVHAAPSDAPNQDPDALGRFVSRTADLPLNTAAFGPPDPGRTDIEGTTAEWERARRLGCRIHAHVGRSPDSAGVVASLGERGRLGSDVTLVHCSHLADSDLDAIAASGAAVSITPSSEMARGLGSPPMQRLIDRRIRPGLGVDDERIAPGDIFAQMRAAISIQHGRYFDLKLAGKGGLPNLLTTREVIRYATLDGARAAGLDSVAGSLQPGKQADLVVLRTDRPNIQPVNDPIGAVVWGMDTSNVGWVIVGGRVLLRDGNLEADTAALRVKATDAQRRVAADAGVAVSIGAT